jgi:hypothetical protein
LSFLLFSQRPFVVAVVFSPRAVFVFPSLPHSPSTPASSPAPLRTRPAPGLLTATAGQCRRLPQDRQWPRRRVRLWLQPRTSSLSCPGEEPLPAEKMLLRPVQQGTRCVTVLFALDCLPSTNKGREQVVVGGENAFSCGRQGFPRARFQQRRCPKPLPSRC